MLTVRNVSHDPFYNQAFEEYIYQTYLDDDIFLLWQNAPAVVLGITRGTGRGHLARAVLECIAYQVTDLMLAMRQDAGCDITMLRADGGASVSDILLQMQADLLRIPVDRPEMVETTAFGAAALAGLSCGVWRDMEELKALRRSQRVFLPEGTQADCDRNYRLWKRAVSRAADWIEH